MNKPVAVGFLIASQICSAAGASAEIGALKCKTDVAKATDQPFEFVITIYSDGTPARIGVATGVGSKAEIWHDRQSGAVVVLELNTDGIPDTLTTINSDLTFVQSRHLLSLSGTFAPSQHKGRCERLEF